MTKLSDTQLVILSNAAARPDRNALPLPGSLRGGAAGKVVSALLSRGLVAERIIETKTKADASLNRLWRNEPDGRAVLLEITDVGLATIDAETGESVGCAQGEGDPITGPAGESRSAPLGGVSGETSVDEPGTEKAAHDAAVAPRARKTREGTKQATLIAMLRAPGGATIAEIAAATGWQAHTVRGALSGALKKKLGLEVTSEKDGARGRVYSIR
ncbi:MAG: DUF3489 domain-containing protein [Pikeienuella sp.]|uniref:DUF3489 domain-containing protein n=1 Tax=Pikeienuella sp. TaxID=2831957 RepID=UPI00391A381D